MKKEYEFFELINELQNTKRYVGYHEEFVESVPEHTYKMIVMIDRLYDLLQLNLDYRKCIKIAIYHDLCEIGLKQDIDALEAWNNIELQLSKKEQEDKKMREISQKYNSEIYDYFKEYEECESLEAKFVHAIDKLEANIRVLKESNVKYKDPDLIAVYAAKAVENFPLLIPFYKELKMVMKERYKQLSFEWKPEYDFSFENHENNN